jgi:hypothetical protein
MNTIVAESWVTLNARLLRKNVIVLSLEIANNLAEAKPPLVTRIRVVSISDEFLPRLVVNLIAKTRCIDNR